MLTANLIGPLLDLWVARVIGPDHRGQSPRIGTLFGIATVCWHNGKPFAPSNDWAHGGPLIPGGVVDHSAIHNDHAFTFVKDNTRGHGTGPTLLIAAMRALVHSVYGDTVP